MCAPQMRESFRDSSLSLIFSSFDPYLAAHCLSSTYCTGWMETGPEREAAGVLAGVHRFSMGPFLWPMHIYARCHHVMRCHLGGAVARLCRLLPESNNETKTRQEKNEVSLLFHIKTVLNLFVSKKIEKKFIKFVENCINSISNEVVMKKNIS